jgi:hypothetical protein
VVLYGCGRHILDVGKPKQGVETFGRGSDAAFPQRADHAREGRKGMEARAVFRALRHVVGDGDRAGRLRPLTPSSAGSAPSRSRSPCYTSLVWMSSPFGVAQPLARWWSILSADVRTQYSKALQPNP